ncbi:L,D-transpeptidase [Ancylobacter dichloromethanicus]|uniref:L,D-TPase catalytic domain-containing protein n=1 Tax=Ancylobacter dichloromethanicus TaxID=518825 RepID=A0A9W6JDN4_9HYPH|nr:L,D-transpeptidase [Ancylobacter dichloromethanicus]MBS7555171.1 L,D-transpeptidase [Ancylobacter dichloromethanicus]GLK73673.1 hypothetical protein GCM10017643_37910 [Ancylobacter dichloromethanicus]
MKSIGSALALALTLLLAQPGHSEVRVAAAVDATQTTDLPEAAPGIAPPATVAAPADTTPVSTATPAALSAPMVSTTPEPAPAATPPPMVQSSLTPPVADPKPVFTPRVVARISLSKQRMEVWVEGVQRHSWPVSTARKGYRTPVGTYRPGRMHKRYFSRKYDNAPMPYAIFFHKGWAIHGTNDLRRLGRPASHGCVRLHPGNAKALFALVTEYGRANTQIVVSR